MLRLFDLGITEDMFNMMIEINPSIKEITDDEVLEKEKILKDINCSRDEIINIISFNPEYLTSVCEDIINLFNELRVLGFSDLNILIDSNPNILNLDVFEINNYLNKRKTNGEDLTDIIDNLENDPSLFNEM